MTRRRSRAAGPPRNPKALKSFAAAMKTIGARRRSGKTRWPSPEYWEALLTLSENHAAELIQADGPMALFKQIAVASDSIMRQKLIQARELRRLITGDEEPDARATR